jgi:hypothetical protein
MELHDGHPDPWTAITHRTLHSDTTPNVLDGSSMARGPERRDREQRPIYLDELEPRRRIELLTYALRGRSERSGESLGGPSTWCFARSAFRRDPPIPPQPSRFLGWILGWEPTRRPAEHRARRLPSTALGVNTPESVRRHGWAVMPVKVRCHKWAVMRRGLVIVDRVTERAFCAALPDRTPPTLLHMPVLSGIFGFGA